MSKETHSLLALLVFAAKDITERQNDLVTGEGLETPHQYLLAESSGTERDR